MRRFLRLVLLLLVLGSATAASSRAQPAPDTTTADQHGRVFMAFHRGLMQMQ